MSFGILFPNKLGVSSKRNPFIDSNWCSYMWHTCGDFFETHTVDNDLFVMFIGFHVTVLFFGRRYRFFLSKCLQIATFFLYPMMKVKEIEANTVIEFQISDLDISLLSPALRLGVSPRGFPIFCCKKNTLGQNGEMTSHSQRSLWLLLII